MTDGTLAGVELAPTHPDAAWHRDLTAEGPEGDEALARLRTTLLQATLHQVWRLRDQLPGAGSGDLEDLAEQAANDALLAVLRQLETFEGRSRFTTWVWKFGVLHAGVAVRRQAWRHREVALADSLPLTDATPTPASVLEAGELRRAVELAIQRDLTPHQRVVALALLVEGVPIDVLAERTGSTRNALYKTLHDARRRIRASLTAAGLLDSPTPRSPR
ncbi:RNA polymerase sigma factor [Nocardioides jejuensis]|uniref:Sigma-70 family RNA polymerase sigma factor n=1 Tax=Nocardioides jejuensis TaxID=2502782 RepID=A0A4R1C2F1_9ACTN|nr:sigma-70 family RNA polymerase sigma factor [Nocardioides jejuensis]TCJ23926.1 sigma-70 family RNA polymerase sigma factor [Nocardioides jejuensis]